MANARQEAAWQRTATLLALIANTHRDPRRRRAYTPADFLPTTRETATPPADLTLLKTVFVDRPIPKGPTP